MVVPPEGRKRERRSEAGELLAEDDAAWDAQTPGHDEPPPHHAAVVRDAEDDFDSWDSEMLPWLNDDNPEPDEKAAWGEPAPEPAEQRLDEPAPAARARPHGESIDALLLKEMPIRSGGPDLTPEQLGEVMAERERAARQRRIELGLEAGEDDDEETPERRAADLLDRDDTQWSRSGGEPTDGVIG